MNEIKVFQNEDFGKIRTVVIDDSPWFVGKDVATALGYIDISHAVLDKVSKEDRINSKTRGQNAPELGQRGTWLINESGLYSLILSSKLESAQKFKHWVTGEVLPAIRKNGSYVAANNQKSERELDLEERKIKLEEGKFLNMLADSYRNTNPKYAQVLDAYASRSVTGTFALPLPQTERTYSATEIGKIIGISNTKVGIIANSLKLKTDEYGKWFVDKARGLNKEVSTFRYYENAIDAIKNELHRNPVWKSE